MLVIVTQDSITFPSSYNSLKGMPFSTLKFFRTQIARPWRNQFQLQYYAPRYFLQLNLRSDIRTRYIWNMFFHKKPVAQFFV